MKNKGLLIAIVLFAVAGWGGYLAYLAANNLVTLDVRDMPVREVCKKIERQTWEKVFVNRDVEGKVTFKVDKAPIEQVLAIISEQTDSRWTSLYPLYTGRPQLDNFKAVVLGDKVAAESGWTNFGNRPFMMRGMFADGVSEENDLVSANIEGKDLGITIASLSRFARAQIVPQDGTAGTINLTASQMPMESAVASVAKQVDRKWKHYFALQGTGRFRGPPGGPGGTNGFPGTNMLAGNFRGRWDSPEAREALEKQRQQLFETLTPEQRQKEEERRKREEEMRNLPPEQREQKMRDFMNSEEGKRMMDQRMMGSLMNSTPEKRVERDRMMRQRFNRGGPGGPGGGPGGGGGRFGGPGGGGAPGGTGGGR